MSKARVAAPQGTLPLQWPGGRRNLWVDGVNSAAAYVQQHRLTNRLEGMNHCYYSS